MLLFQANPPSQQDQHYFSNLYSANVFVAFQTAVQTVWRIWICICDLAFDFVAFWILSRSTWLLTYPGTTRNLGNTRERELSTYAQIYDVFNILDACDISRRSIRSVHPLFIGLGLSFRLRVNKPHNNTDRTSQRHW